MSNQSLEPMNTHKRQQGVHTFFPCLLWNEGTWAHANTCMFARYRRFMCWWVKISYVTGGSQFLTGPHHTVINLGCQKFNRAKKGPLSIENLA